MPSTLEELQALAEETADAAIETTKRSRIKASLSADLYESTWEKKSVTNMLSTTSDAVRLRIGDGYQVWGVVLFFDLRSSSDRAVKIGARDTFVTMHTYLTVMTKIASVQEGLIVNYRGDGAIVAFGGLKRGVQLSEKETGSAMKAASRCGKAMLEGISEVVNPTLKRKNITPDLRIGVGIDIGDVVVTNIGFEKACEITIYGSAVNKACHLASDSGRVVTTERFWKVFPKSDSGRLKRKKIMGRDDAFQVIYPDDYRVLT